tara:strand:+ start:3477 stop:4280 length:804 start_codon:yes stop_codon:yes gene_type:complete
MKAVLMQPDTTNYKGFIIHLKRSQQRKNQVIDLISKIPFDTEIVDAIDGHSLPQTTIDNYYSKKTFFKPKYPFTMNIGEIGCFLSHRSVWKKIVAQNLTAGIIFEDDVQIDPNVFSDSLKSSLKWSSKYGYIQFQVRDIPQKSKILHSDNNVKLIQPSPILLRTSAQLVSYATAVTLLENTKKFDRPIDGMLQMHWFTGVNPVCIVPSGVTDRTHETGGSTLSIKKSNIISLYRIIQRIIYRIKIRNYSKIIRVNTSKDQIDDLHTN